MPLVCSAGDEGVGAGAEAKFFSMGETGLPVGVGVQEFELVVTGEVLVLVGVLKFIVSRQDRRFLDEIDASLVEGDRVG